MAERDSQPTVAIIDAQSVKNSATATKSVGIDGGKLIKGRKRFILVDTMGPLLWAGVRPAIVADGETGIGLWEQAELHRGLVEEAIKCTLTVRLAGNLKLVWKTITI
ncbi:transposase [Spirosoma taeanense]|uniref:transposase n=1 Tax=Spirosoma taeanense TaxID=2735870 RepID=UPI001F040FC6|nr:transposase [Spirosoma taeanense]